MVYSGMNRYSKGKIYKIVDVLDIINAMLVLLVKV